VSQQITNLIRAAILTGELAPGAKLPSQPDLANHYGVARETVKRALETLRSERLIVTRQGSGSFVRVQRGGADILGPAIAAAVTSAELTIDFAGVSADKLRDALLHALGTGQAGQHAPKSITVRIMLPAANESPAPLGPIDADADYPMAAERQARATHQLGELAKQLSSRHRVKTVTAEVRTLHAAPMLDVYVLNRHEVLLGFNPVRPQPGVRGRGQVDDIVSTDRDVPMLHHFAGADASHDRHFVAAAQAWFDSIWNTTPGQEQSRLAAPPDERRLP
jgi:DNA-binding transcriptional regulator YhcF (GntR family)